MTVPRREVDLFSFQFYLLLASFYSIFIHLFSLSLFPQPNFSLYLSFNLFNFYFTRQLSIINIFFLFSNHFYSSFFLFLVIYFSILSTYWYLPNALLLLLQFNWENRNIVTSVCIIVNTFIQIIEEGNKKLSLNRLLMNDVVMPLRLNNVAISDLS